MGRKQRHLQTRNGHFYFRISVPIKFYKFFKRKELVVSLSTTCPHIAQSKALVLQAQLHALFGRVHSMSNFNPNQINALLKHYLSQSLPRMSHLIETARHESDASGSDVDYEILSSCTDFFIPAQLVSTNKGLGKPCYSIDAQTVASGVIAENGYHPSYRGREYLIIKEDYAPLLIQHMSEAYKQHLKGEPLDQISLESKIIPVLISSLWEQYINEQQREGLNERTLKDKEISFNLFVELIGDVPIRKVEKAHAREFKEVLLKLPSNRHQRYKGLSIGEILQRNIPKSSLLSPRTVKAYISDLSGFFKWVIANRDDLTANPFTGITVKDNVSLKDKRKSWDDVDLVKIFSAPNKANSQTKRLKRMHNDTDYWIPRLGLYTGARLNELCQLFVSDIREENGVYYLDINEDHPTKSLKNQGSERRIPVHGKLIKMGFIEYVMAIKNQGHERLFPQEKQGANGTYGDDFSKRFGHFKRKLGFNGREKCFHSFRHLVIDELRNNGQVSRDIQMFLTGHTDKSVHGKYGSKGPSIEVLKEAIETIQFPCLDSVWKPS